MVQYRIPIEDRVKKFAALNISSCKRETARKCAGPRRTGSRADNNLVPIIVGDNLDDEAAAFLGKYY
jgi:hypothetical protein